MSSGAAAVGHVAAFVCLSVVANRVITSTQAVVRLTLCWPDVGRLCDFRLVTGPLDIMRHSGTAEASIDLYSASNTNHARFVHDWLYN